MELKEFKRLYYITRDSDLARLLGAKTPHTIQRIAIRNGLSPKGKGYLYPDDKRFKINLG